MGRVRTAIAAAVLLATACGGSGGDGLPTSPSSIVSFNGTSASLRVAVADTPDARRRGLMGVNRLAADEGMAFVFDEPVSTTFWMKDTPLPLSIAFVSEGGRIVTIRDMEPCTGACPRYGADGPFTLAIEAHRGWFAAHGIGVGDTVELRELAYG